MQAVKNNQNEGQCLPYKLQDGIIADLIEAVSVASSCPKLKITIHATFAEAVKNQNPLEPDSNLQETNLGKNENNPFYARLPDEGYL